MASVFLSYDHEDAERATPIAAALEKAGHSVWWDRQIAGGAEYNSEIENAVERADAVVVLWSERSVRSAWVRDEAAEGRDRGKLVPATIDGVKPPMGFRQYQTIDLSKRSGRLQNVDQLLRAIGNMAPSDAMANTTASVRAPGHGLHGPGSKWPLLTLLLVLLLVGTAVVAWRTSHRSSVPVVVVIPSQPSGDAEALARDLLVKLGNLRAAKTDSLQLTGARNGDPAKADFIFETSGGTNSRPSGFDLALLSGKNRSVLWSKDFELDAGGIVALQQRVAYAAGQVLGCALEARTANRSELDEQTLKLYLNGCALFAEIYRADPRTVAPIFSKVLARAPRFQPAWAKLLLAEGQITRSEMLFYNRSVPGALPQHIRAAEKLNPRLPELYIAKMALLPIAAFRQRQQLVDKAFQVDPDNPHLLVVRSELYEFVGRIDEAVHDAARAAELRFNFRVPPR